MAPGRRGRRPKARLARRRKPSRQIAKRADQLSEADGGGPVHWLQAERELNGA